MDRVLIIDDDDLMLSVLREILELGGYEVVTTDDGERGIELFRKFKPALVITDLIMPHTDGVHVIQEIRRRSQTVRIIAISGTPRIETMSEAVQAEAKERGKKAIWLHTSENNVKAHKVFDRGGWVHESTVYPPWRPTSRTRIYRKAL